MSVGLLLIPSWSSAALVQPSVPLHGAAAAAAPALAARRHQSLLLYTPTDAKTASGPKWLQASRSGEPEASVSFLEELQSQSARLGGDEEQQEALWPWRAAMLAITACWGANFAVTSYAMDALGGDATDGALFVAARFLVGAGALLPFLASAGSTAVCVAGAQVGALCAAGYAAQAVALALGTEAGTAAFICSLQSVVVALMASRKTGGVAAQTWLAVALSVAGVGCLELLHDPTTAAAAAESVAEAGAGSGGSLLGDLIALGQPLGFGLSYVVLEDAMAKHPEDELPLAALQCAVIAIAAVGAAAVGAHAVPWDLHWEHLLPAAPVADVGGGGAMGAAGGGAAGGWGVPLAIAYTGLISTSLTIWLQAKVFKRLPSTDASIILSSEPLWAVVVAAMLLHAEVGVNTVVGGALILSALACNEGLFNGQLEALLEALLGVGGAAGGEEAEGERPAASMQRK